MWTGNLILKYVFKNICIYLDGQRLCCKAVRNKADPEEDKAFAEEEVNAVNECE